MGQESPGEGGQHFRKKKRQNKPLVESNQSITGAGMLLSTAQHHQTRQVSTYLYRLKLMRFFFSVGAERKAENQKSLKEFSAQPSPF